MGRREVDEIGVPKLGVRGGAMKEKKIKREEKKWEKERMQRKTGAMFLMQNASCRLTVTMIWYPVGGTIFGRSGNFRK